jgi:TolA-binding protein
LYTERQEFDTAVKLLEEALGKDLAAGLADRVRIRLGTVYAARGDLKGALAKLDAVARNTNRPGAGQAQYQAGECLMAVRDYERAAARLAAFRDEEAFQNLPGLTDRALVRLGHAYEHLKSWDRARDAYQRLMKRFGKGPWAAEARYGIGFAWQNEKEYDKAVAAYTHLTRTSSGEIAAKAQFQIGLCRRAQKRYGDAAAAFLVVSLTYDYPEWSAAGLCEAARTLVIEKKHRQAEKLLRRVIQEHPRSKWAEVAREKLQELTEG